MTEPEIIGRALIGFAAGFFGIGGATVLGSEAGLRYRRTLVPVFVGIAVAGAATLIYTRPTPDGIYWLWLLAGAWCIGVTHGRDRRRKQERGLY